MFKNRLVLQSIWSPFAMPAQLGTTRLQNPLGTESSRIPETSLQKTLTGKLPAPLARGPRPSGSCARQNNGRKRRGPPRKPRAKLRGRARPRRGCLRPAAAGSPRARGARPKAACCSQKWRPERAAGRKRGTDSLRRQCRREEHLFALQTQKFPFATRSPLSINC